MEYKYKRLKIIDIKEETASVRTLTLQADRSINIDPGQFIVVRVSGIGEAPFCPYYSSDNYSQISITVKNRGLITGSLHKLNKNSFLDIRGPYGNPFPLDRMKGNEIVIAARNYGIIKIRPLINELLINRNVYPRVSAVLSMDGEYKDFMKDEIEEKSKSIEMHLLDNKELVNSTLGKINIDFDSCYAAVSAESSFTENTAVYLNSLGVSYDRISIPLERNIVCATGKCRHCLIDNIYVCKDGPVVTYEKAAGLLKRYEIA